jgi:pimeloyl-ACP methyl ester carboxylesterase
MLEKLKQLQYGARVKLYSGDQLKQVELDDRRVRLLRAGAGEPLVYLHSAIGETMWLPFHQGLARAFEVFAPAHPGFAGSSGEEEIDQMEDVIFHYLDLFDALGLERFNLAGASFGGWIAAEFALRYPERIRRLVLASAAGLWLNESPPADLFAKLQDTAALRRLLLANPRSFVGDLLFPDQPDEARLEAALRGMQAVARLGWSPPMHNPKLRARLRRVTAPTLVLWGAEDRFLPPAYAAAFSSAIPQAEVRLIKNCGHLPMFEQESEFVAAVTKFLLA